MNTHLIGNPGTGKTTTLIDTALTDIENGEGVLFVDLHGSAVDTICRHIPSHRVNDILVLDPSDTTVRWNLIHNVPEPHIPQYATTFRDTIIHLQNYTGATPYMSRVLFNSIATLMYRPHSSLLDVERLLTDKHFRATVLKDVKDSYLVDKWAYWTSKNERDYDAMISSSENKIGEFSEDLRVRAVMQGASSFDLKQMLFEKKVILLRLPEGQLGISRASSFASLFLAHVKAVVSARTIHIPLNIYLDDFQHLDTPVLRQFLSSGDRYGVSLMLANQFLAQLSPELRSSVIGNCATRIMFQTGIEDSEYLHRTIPYNNTMPKLHELSSHQILTFADGTLETGFAVKPRGKGSQRTLKRVLESSRRRYGG